MGKHTPGPWIVDNANPHRVIMGAKNEWVVSATQMFDGGACILIDEADLALILAAPDLLAALEDAIKHIDAILDGRVSAETHKEGLAAVKRIWTNVVAKAEGRE